MINQGIHGPVQIIASSNGSADIIRDLSNNQWVYKVGLHGEDKKICNGRARYNQWKSDNLPVNKPFVWYKVLIFCISLILHIPTHRLKS